MGVVREWLTRSDGTRRSALWRVAGLVGCMNAAVIGAAPYADSRTGDGHLLFGLVALVLLVDGMTLVVFRGLSDRWGAALGLVLPTVLVLVVMARTVHVGSLVILLAWPSLAGAYSASRTAVWGNLLLIAAGVAGVVVLTPDPAVSWLTWAAVVAACTGCAATVQLVAEHNDAVVISLSDRAARDPLTGLLNRRAFDEQLDELWAGGRPMAVVFFDLDHFKIVNDTYGHPVGDAVLTEFARVLRGHVRDDDVVARTGGEEFGAVMPERCVSNVLERAQAIVDAFAATRIQADDLVLRCTVSAGVALREDRHLSASQLCRDADRALYLAKEGGRNQAVLREGDFAGQA